MNDATISDLMRELAFRRRDKLTPERRTEIARDAGRASKGIPRPNAKGKPKPRRSRESSDN